jgi:hypothetical protein
MHCFSQTWDATGWSRNCAFQTGPSLALGKGPTCHVVEIDALGVAKHPKKIIDALNASLGPPCCANLTGLDTVGVTRQGVR